MSTPTVHERILADRKARLEAIPEIGRVVGVFEDDASGPGNIGGDVLKDGKCVVELAGGDLTPETGLESIGLVGWTFALIADVTLPTPLPAPYTGAGGPPAYAAMIHGKIYEAWQGSAAARACDPGTGALAVDGDWAGGGGVSIDAETGALFVSCVQAIRFRHLLDDPGVAG